MGVVRIAMAAILWCGMQNSAHNAVAAESPVIAAASSLNPALADVADEFTMQTGYRVRLSFGASGNIARQIMQGAPYELFLSADESYALAVADPGLTQGPGTLYAVGRLALFVPNGSAVVADNELSDLAVAASDGRLRRLAIANPDHAPYGRAARELLQHRGLWERVQDKLVMGESVAQAAQFAVSGGADAALFSYSATLSPHLQSGGTAVLLPAGWHEPLRHRMVLLKNAGSMATAFYDFVLSAPARAILERHGFTQP